MSASSSIINTEEKVHKPLQIYSDFNLPKLSNVDLYKAYYKSFPCLNTEQECKYHSINKCYYYHNKSEYKKPICTHFVNLKKCKYGDDCSRDHNSKYPDVPSHVYHRIHVALDHHYFNENKGGKKRKLEDGEYDQSIELTNAFYKKSLLTNKYQEELVQLEDDYNRLKNDYTHIKDDYSLLKKDYNRLKDDYTLNKDDYNRLKKDYTLIKEDFYQVKDENKKLLNSQPNVTSLITENIQLKDILNQQITDINNKQQLINHFSTILQSLGLHINSQNVENKIKDPRMK